MKLAIVNLTGGGLSGGYRKYLAQLVPLLASDPRVSRLLLILPPGQSWQGVAATEVISLVRDGPFTSRQLLGSLRDFSPDVLFIPTARWLSYKKVPTVVMVQNMEPLTVPFGGNPMLESARNLVRAYAARQACRRAARVIAISRYVQDFLVERWRVPPDRIGLVYHGVDPPDPAGMVMPPLLGRYAPAPFIFTAGSIRPARGLEDVIRGMALLAPADPVRLVIAGQADRVMTAYRRRMHRLASALGIVQKVLWVGQLSPPEMAWCYAHCAAFVITSRAEACPNTALEALSQGCQIIAVDRPPMPELLVDGAWYYRAGDPGDLAKQIERLLRISASAAEASRAVARARAQAFTWAEAASRTIDQLEMAVASATTPVFR